MTSVQEYECVFCNESFDNKEALQIHFRKHADPNFNKGRAQTASPSLDSSRDGVELVSCDVCTEMFPTISKAITHKHKVHPEHDAKYFCPWCGKLFTMKHLYNKHIQANHSTLDRTEKKNFHCDWCNVDFYTPTAVLNHNKFFHRQDTDIPPFGQSKKLKMFNQEVIPIFYCSFCGEEYDNKVNLHKHASDDHNDENQSPDVVMRCPLCDAIFYHLDAYELHLTFHTSDDLYSERCEMIDDITEYSLESVPPIMEKVENCELQQDAETTMKEVGIEDFLEQALEEPEGIITKKNKKHKKHKKSKQPAITLDEFLSMNKDVFGEGLDFQGVEEVPTQVITKKLKVAKRTPNTSSAIAPELEKLRKHGIVIKKKPGHGVSVPNKVQYNKSLKPAQRFIAKAQVQPKVRTSVDMLDKIINKTNNQIKIVKKCNKDNYNKNENSSPKLNKIHDTENYLMECDSTKKDGEFLAKESSSLEESDAIEKEIEIKTKAIVLQTNCNHHEKSNENTENIDSISKETEEDLNENVMSLKCVPTNTSKVESSTNNLNKDEEDVNAIDNMSEKIDKNVSDVDNSNITNKIDSLTSLKHLSHLITVKPVTNKISTTTDSSCNKNDLLTNTDVTLKGNLGLSPFKDIVEATDLKTDETLNDLMPSTSKNVPPNSLSPQPKSDSINLRLHEQKDIDDEIAKNKSGKSITTKTNSPINVKYKNSDLIQSQHISTNTGKKTNIVCDVKYNDKQETTNLLKHLTGITAKPVNVLKGLNKTNTLPPIKNTNFKNVKVNAQKEEINDDEIEIFSIDDSDDENDSSSQINNESVSNSTQNVDVLKNLSKNITIKSLSNNKNPPENNEVLNDVPSNDKNNHSTDDKFAKHDTNISDLLNKNPIPKLVKEKDTVLTYALKNLSKNITVKSRNSSPSHTVTSRDQNVSNCEEIDDDLLPSVKITEINDCEGDDEFETNIKNNGDNVIVESPDDSNSDKMANEEMDMEEADFENQIKVNMLKRDEHIKTSENHASTSGTGVMTKDKLNHLSEDTDGNDDSSEGNPAIEIKKNLGKQISIRPLKNVRKEMNQETAANSEESFGHQTCHSVTNQRMSTSNQVNTVNKEVTVKTFHTQTKTVVQEITTTVTKTIKTVNQTLKQEVRNVSNYNPTTRLPQKVQGMKVNQQSKNLQGIVVRHSSPLVRPKIRNTPPAKSAVGTAVRQSSQVIPVGTSVRASNQIVPIGPRSNVVGTSNPRMPYLQKTKPSMSNPNTAKMTRPLKVSPEALILPAKRPNAEETSGPFSCFKKPKESLIPVSDVTLNSSDAESLSEYSSLSKSSSMNMVSTSKGRSVTTSTQMKSEVSASSLQLGRLNNISGIKMTKTSQSKQVQVHENNEVSSSHRTALEAIQKLQKQGLLVKKPRLDIKNNSDDSNNSDDNDSTDNDV